MNQKVSAMRGWLGEPLKDERVKMTYTSRSRTTGSATPNSLAVLTFESSQPPV